MIWKELELGSISEIGKEIARSCLTVHKKAIPRMVRLLFRTLLKLSGVGRAAAVH